MKCRFISIIMAMIFVLQGLGSGSFAQEKGGKAILIMLNRTGLDDMLEIESLKSELENRGYIGLMNIKGSNGSSDMRSYASIGWGARAYVNPGDIEFVQNDDETGKVFERRAGISPGELNNIGINRLIATNEQGEYSTYPGILQNELKKNGKKIAFIGNSDTPDETLDYAALIAMDEHGRVESGVIDGLNVEDDSMPFGIRNDYGLLKKYTKDYYSKSDVVVVELGDTHRLDIYKENLNDKTYSRIKKEIYDDVSEYIGYVLSDVASSGDRVYVVSPYPKLLDYKNYQRLSPVIVFENDGKGVLYSDSTRREGIIGNVDIAADVLDYFGISSEYVTGKAIQKIGRSDNIDFLRSEFEKAIIKYQVRIPVLYTYAVIEMLLWIIIFVCILMKDKVSKKIFRSSAEILQFTVVVPFVLLVEPVFGIKSKLFLILVVCAMSVLFYALTRKFISGDIERLVTVSIVTGAGILMDAATGQTLIKRSIFGYDPMIGARYYGVGNEYMGILIGAVLLSVAWLLQNKKISRKIAIIVLACTIIILGFPQMGANVGGTITATFCFLFFVLRLYDLKMDLKKFVMLSFAVCLVVAAMASIDIFVLGSKSHLASAVQGIIAEGPAAIFLIIKRKLEMNFLLIGASIWSKVFIIALFIVGVLFYRPFGVLKKVCNEKEILAKGWIAIIVGSFVGFAVNDSGVVSAATSISFVIISVLLLIMGRIVKEKA